MVARSAYDQLHYSPLLLAGTVLGMLLTYLLPPLFALFGTGLAQAVGAVTWALMTIAFLPDHPVLSPRAALGRGASCDRGLLHGVHAGLGFSTLARQRRALERPRASAPGGGIMTAGPVWEAGEKTHKDENFPVASHLVSKQHRPVILAFYRFARAADDVADHPSLHGRAENPHARPVRRDAARAKRRHRGRAALARRDYGARAYAEARAGFARRFPHGRQQAPLRRLGRPHPLLLLFGHAGGPLRARCAWRKPRDLARQRCALRGAANHQSPAGLRRGLPPPRPRLHSAWTLWLPGASRSKRSPRRKASPELAGLHPRTCSENTRFFSAARIFRATSRTCASASKWPPSSGSRENSCKC